jgi:metal-responsive CopG/Arc/MetJ family transcriptional regulator
MKPNKELDPSMTVPPREAPSVRASVSFPSEVYQTLEEIARQKKVSLAWVVRDAAEQYIENKWPILKKTSL